MSTKNFSIVAAAGLVAVLVYWFGFRDTSEKPKDAPVVQKAAPVRATTTTAPKVQSQQAGTRNVEVSYQDDPEGSLRLEGQVINAEDDPVAGAIVTLDSRPPRFTKTAEDGSFFFDSLVARNYDVVAQSKDGAAGPVTARLSETNDPIILVLRAGGTVNVHVNEPGGTALANAQVELRGIAVQAANTDAAGLASFAQVPVSYYEVIAKASGYAPQRSTVVVSRSGASAEVSLTLKAGAMVSGVVVDPDGKPVAGAQVLYQGASDWSVRADARLDHVLSESDGSFTIAALPRGSFRFVADAKNFAQGSSEVIALDGESETTGVEIRMEPSAILRGRVLSADGTPIAAARVRVAAKGAGVVRRDGGVRQAYTDDEGKYEVRELRRRAYEVVALHETASSEIVNADLSKAPFDATLDLSLSIDGVIAGIVVDSNDEPMAGAQITLFPDFRKGASRSDSEWRMRGLSTELTDAGGKFRVSGLAPNTAYRVRAVPGTSNNPGRAWLSEGTPARTGDEDVRIVLRADGGIRGKVALANGEAPELFTVSVGWQRGTPFSSKDGSFELSDLPPQTFTVVITGPGIDEARVKDVVVNAGEYTDVGSITAKKGRSISGTVLDLGGSPIAGAKVSAGRVIFGDGSSSEAGSVQNPMARATKTVTSGEDGRFSIYGVVGGDLSIIADHETIGRSMPVSVRQSNDSLDGITLQLQKTGALQGIVSVNSAAEEGVIITATSLRHPGVTFNVSSGADGGYRFDRLIADTYRVKAMFGSNPMSGMSFFAEKSDVVADETTTLDIDFDDGGATVRVVLSADEPLGFTWLSIIGNETEAKTARQLNDAMSEAIGFEGASMSIRGNPASAKNVPPGSYSVCALVYPTEVSGMENTFAYMEREGDNLPAQCKPLKVPEGSTEVELQMTVVIPDFIADPNSAPATAPETAP
tara:strand:- start:17501 stop:20290 length:2790 start_codon:yes stop_codon:yes gene_type:complete